MLYMLVNRTRPDLPVEAWSRLAELARTFYADVPEGLTLHGDWSALDGSGGFALLETEDPALVERLAAPFEPYVEIRVVPVRVVTGWTAPDR